MSQEKVDRYKQNKANREKIMKKEKRIRRIEYSLTALVLCGLLCWCGVSIYQKVEKSKAAETTVYEVDADAVESYVDSLTASDTSETSETSETAETSTAE